MLFSDPHNPTAVRLRKALEPEIQGLVADPKVAIVIGGDGFMLQTIGETGLEPTYLGINAGRIGFLMNDVDDLRHLIDQLHDERWTSWSFPLLHAEITVSDGRVISERALNDVAIERSTGQTAHLCLRLDGRTVVERLVADGLVMSTSIGSTAYGLSAGGPASHPSLHLVGITPICPHHPRLSPLLMPPGVTCQLEVLDAPKRPVRVVADGRTHDDAVGLTVHLGEPNVNIAWLEGHDFTTKLVQKILRV